MKIVVVQDVLRSGGTERQSVLLARGFHARGHDTLLLTFRPGGALAGSVEGFEHRALQPFDFGWDWFAPALSAQLRRQEPDAVLAMGRMANCHLGSVVGPVHRRAGRPGVAIATFRTGKRLPWLYRRSLQICDHVVANSEQAAARLREREGLAPSRVSVIYNSLVFAGEGGPDEARDEVRARFGAGAGTFVFLSVAMFRPEKNQRELIEIAAGLPRNADWQLWLAGDGPCREACVLRVRELGLERRVMFPGLVLEPQPLYRAADAAVHASWSESLSNFLIEAQASGLPAVAYEAQGIAECFLPDRTGWAIPRDRRDRFRECLARLMSAPAAERATRSLEAKAFAARRFNPERQIEAYLALFERLVGGTRRTGFESASPA